MGFCSASTVGVESMSSIASSAGALALQQAAKAAAAGSNKADSFVEDYFRKKAAGNDNTEPSAFVKQYFKDLETSKEINPPSSQNSNPKDTSSNAAHKNKDSNNGNGDFVDQVGIFVLTQSVYHFALLYFRPFK